MNEAIEYAGIDDYDGRKVVHGSLIVGYGRHHIWIDTDVHPQCLDLIVHDHCPHHCGGHRRPVIGSIEVYDHGFSFVVEVPEGTAEVKWRYYE